MKKICPNDYEHAYWPEGKLVLGMDEAGRGPLAGPLTVAGVIFPAGYENPDIYDSKAVSEKKRERLYDMIMEDALWFEIREVSEEDIDRYNIYRADQMAMDAMARESGAEVILTDAMPLEIEGKTVISLVKGDQKSISIAAASILAKVTRDTYMKEMDALYPQYGFAGHKGYGTRAHCQAILDYGPSPIHRRSFLGKILAGKEDAVNQPWEPGDKPDFLFSGRVPSGRETGQRGEETAVRFLSDRGVRILERNFRDRDGEIDIIGEEDGTLVFFEVKYRSSARWGDPAEAVTPEKQRTISRTARYYLYKTGRGTEIPMRFDVVCVTGKEIRWIRDAFSCR